MILQLALPSRFKAAPVASSGGVVSTQLDRLPARSGRAVEINAGSVIDIVNTYGTQVIDTWAICPSGDEWLSMEHTRAGLLRLIPRAGDQLLTNTRRPVVTVIEDSSPGVHDTLVPACDPQRYRTLGCTSGHENCHDNFVQALETLGLALPVVPPPLNLFMNVPWMADGTLSFEAPVAAPGDYIRLRAEIDVIVVMSACPQDMVPVNGSQMRPTDAHFRIV
jgi:hypothetical protein